MARFIFEAIPTKGLANDVSVYVEGILAGGPTGLIDILAACSPRAPWTHKLVACRALEAAAAMWAEGGLPTIVPIVTQLVYDSKRAVAEAALAALGALYGQIGNRDVEPFVPCLLKALREPETVGETIHHLSSIVFVQEVRDATLSVLVPLLLRGYMVPATAVRRKCCVITENMCKLVDDPVHVRIFLPQLLPPVRKLADEVADPECRGVAERVHKLLLQMVGAARDGVMGGRGDKEDDDEEVLCDCRFSLAYGAKILLNRAGLRLVRGGRYGICGANGCGKSTLMRAIVADQVDGFPGGDMLRRVYVEHDVDGEMADTPVLEYVVGSGSGAAECEAALRAVGFDDARLKAAVGSLSGGWKMKLALARAMMQKPDLLLLDEPTNHLDHANVEWLQQYLVGSAATCLIVSHDSGFLDAVCTHIVHYEGLKLRTYKGNLAAFVAQKPEARSYYELAATPMVFKLAEPGFLDGVKTKDKAILKVQGATFAYGGGGPPVIRDVNVYVSLSSRVACVGANGAGKSTLIKLLTGELEPTAGTVWKHPNLRIAYVAQHAFHHIEEHLDMTANEYIRWRYATGEDREAEDKVTRRLTAEEAARLEAKLVVGGVKRVFEKLLGRKKARKSYEYEVKWMDTEETTYLERDELIGLGFEKQVNEFDMKEAAALGLMLKPLTQANVERHLADVGLDAEVATHNRIRGYSGGQKVRLVVAAATWMNPHVIVLDEPSNYLDRDSLGAFSAALQAYGGGVVIISHSREFLDTICNEVWTVADGVVRVERGGEAGGAGGAAVAPFALQDETIDAFGNVIKVKGPATKNLSKKERKARDKARKARRERGEAVSESEDEI
jgi:elongation factor 3